jgi:hypothetical protein
VRDDGTVSLRSVFHHCGFNDRLKYLSGGLGEMGEVRGADRETWQDLLIVGIVPADTSQGIKPTWESCNEIIGVRMGSLVHARFAGGLLRNSDG